MNELIPLTSQTARRPPSLQAVRYSTSHSSSGPTSTQVDGPYKTQKIGKVVKSLRKKLNKMLIRTKLRVSSVSVNRETTIDVLPDDVLLQIFDFCRVDHNPISPHLRVLEWHRLIHVCRRWRQIIFSSPRRLDLYLLCTRGTPVRKNLGRWPAFPILVDYVSYPHYTSKISFNEQDNIIAALEHPDRVRCLKLPVTSLLLGKVAAVAQEPFPMLTQLWLSSKDENVSVIPGAFMGQSAPGLQEIHLNGIPFPTLPTLLSSANDLVVLYLHRIPHSGYISPETMVTTLAALTRLDFLSIEFHSSTSRPNQSGRRRRAAPPTRVVLPALTFFRFRGASEYLEDLVAQIDTPRLAFIRITYFNQLIFQVPQLFGFVGRVQILEQADTKDAQVYFRGSHVDIYISNRSEETESRRTHIFLRISCEGLDWQVSQLAEVLSQSSGMLSNVSHLFIGTYVWEQIWRRDMDHIEWMELFRQFTAVETLQVSTHLARLVADALNDVTVPSMLPALRLLCLEHDPLGSIEEFISTRQRSGIPVTIY